MPSFKIVKNTFHITTSKDWIDSVKFNSKDAVKTYKGREYRIISKKERKFSTIERVGRGMIGTLAVVCTLGLALLAKPVRELFINRKKTVRYAIPLKKTTKETLKELRGNNLKTDKALILQLMKDYSGINHVTLDGRQVDMGTPAFSINRGTGLKPPKKLEEMFPQELKSYFGDQFHDVAPKVALLFQQGIAGEPALRAPDLIDDPIQNTTFFPKNEYPTFDFSKINNEFFLLVKSKGSLNSDFDYTPQRNYTITQLFNLSNPNANVEMKFVKD